MLRRMNAEIGRAHKELHRAIRYVFGPVGLTAARTRRDYRKMHSLQVATLLQNYCRSRMGREICETRQNLDKTQSGEYFCVEHSSSSRMALLVSHHE